MIAGKSWDDVFSYVRQKEIPFFVDESMASHTTFSIGGPATCFIVPECEEQLIDMLTLAAAWDIPRFVLGRGSNLLVDDRGYCGMVLATARLNRLCVVDHMDHMDHTDEEKYSRQIDVQCGVSLRKLALYAKKFALRGAEFLQGIPGSLGGAIRMNAGAFGKEIGDLVVSVRCWNCRTGQVEVFPKEDFAFSARNSLAAQRTELVCLSATLRLTATIGDEEKQEQTRRDIQNLTEQYKQRRRETQPLNYPSAGSVFKRPNGFYAGRLIEDCGLKGTTIGGAQVSDKHAGFIVNIGGATSDDVLSLVGKIKQEVKMRFNVSLEEEIVFLGHRETSNKTNKNVEM